MGNLNAHNVNGIDCEMLMNFYQDPEIKFYEAAMQ